MTSKLEIDSIHQQDEIQASSSSTSTSKRSADNNDDDSNLSYSDHQEDSMSEGNCNSTSSMMSVERGLSQEDNIQDDSRDQHEHGGGAGSSPHGKGASSLLSLFSPPPTTTTTSSSAANGGFLNLQTSLNSLPLSPGEGAISKNLFVTNEFDKIYEKPHLQRQTTQKRSNAATWKSINASVGDYNFNNRQKIVDETANLSSESTRLLFDDYNKTSKGEATDVYHSCDGETKEEKSPTPRSPLSISKWTVFSRFRHRKSCMRFEKISKESAFSTVAGSLILLLFHIVFCLAQASTIHRPFSGRPVLGVMTRMAAVGPMTAGPLFIYALDKEFASVYPSLDCFPAPFYAQMAALVDESLVDAGLENDDVVFLTTLGVLSAVSLVLTGILILIGTKVKLVNLSAFLPYPVMCGFFTSVGVLVWTLAFTVDTGENVWHILMGGDVDKMKYCIKHHLGSIIVGTIIILAGKRHQGLVPILSLLPLPIIYCIMYLSGTSLKEAQEGGWFYSQHQFLVEVSWSNVKVLKWDPPLPFGYVNGVFHGKVHWPAIIKGFPVALSMAVIYFIRCSVHAPALRKNSNNLLKWKSEQDEACEDEKLYLPGEEGQDFYLESIEVDISTKSPSEAKNMSMSDVFWFYGKILSLNGLAGGFACLPAISVGGTLYKLGAVGATPQYGSIVLLAIFYLTKFDVVGFLPKLTFSSLLFVSSIEMIEAWFIVSYKKTVVKSEWAVTPVIVVCTFLVGSLQSVALGLALSTFIFVGTLNKHGVVKFIATGLSVHSITERSAEDAAWLDQNGDLIQLLVLQSYIFFGNAYSCLSYVNSMFEELPEHITKKLSFPLPPFPKYIIIDMTLVSGVDTSSVDIFGEIIQLCFRHKCSVYLSGLNTSLKNVLTLGGLKPSMDKKSANSVLRFMPELDSALSQAEDGLLKSMSYLEEKELRRSKIRSNSSAEDGFLYALKEIDVQHDVDTLSTLVELKPFAKVLELKAGEILNHQGGLYFIEHGMMKVERDSDTVSVRGSLRRRYGVGNRSTMGSVLSLSRLNCRTPTIGKEYYLLKSAGGRAVRDRNTIRIATLKPGFVIGDLGGVVSNDLDSGDYVAVTPCRLWHLSQGDINRLEYENPRLILELFKIMAVLSAQRQEVTIDQLSTLHQIMTSLAPTKPPDRLTMAAIKNVT